MHCVYSRYVNKTAGIQVPTQTTSALGIDLRNFLKYLRLRETDIVRDWRYGDRDDEQLYVNSYIHINMSYVCLYLYAYMTGRLAILESITNYLCYPTMYLTAYTAYIYTYISNGL